MKLQIFALVIVALGCIEGKPSDNAIAAVSCESVLSTKLCDTLRIIANNFKLLPSVVDKAIAQAISTGKSGVELYKEVVNFLKHEARDKTCVDLLAPQVCSRIENIANGFQLSKLVVYFIKEAISNGFPTEEEIFVAVLNLIRTEIVAKDCDEILSKEACVKLLEIGRQLKIDAVRVAKYVKEAVIAGYKKSNDIYQAVLKFFRDDITSLTCEDILNPKVCDVLNKVGQLFQMSPEEITAAVEEAILRGKTEVKDIIEDVKDYIVKVSGYKKCEDILPAKVCSTIKSLAAKLKVKKQLVDEAVMEAMRNGATEIKKVIKFCEDYFRNHVTCESWLGENTCKYVHKVAATVGVKIQEVDDKIRDLVIQGKAAVSELYKEAINFIKQKIWG